MTHLMGDRAWLACPHLHRSFPARPRLRPPLLMSIPEHLFKPFIPSHPLPSKHASASRAPPTSALHQRSTSSNMPTSSASPHSRACSITTSRAGQDRGRRGARQVVPAWRRGELEGLTFTFAEKTARKGRSLRWGIMRRLGGQAEGYRGG